MHYFKTKENLLIQFNEKTNIFKARSFVGRKDTRIPKEQFILEDTTRIKKQEFCRLMNVFFRNIKDEWLFEDIKFKKIDNFEFNKNGECINYDLYNDIPLHRVFDSINQQGYIKVYHWGKIYYYEFYRKRLLCIKTLKHLQYASLKNCSPIFNKTTKKII